MQTKQTRQTHQTPFKSPRFDVSVPRALQPPNPAANPAEPQNRPAKTAQKKKPKIQLQTTRSHTATSVPPNQQPLPSQLPLPTHSHYPISFTASPPSRLPAPLNQPRTTKSLILLPVMHASPSPVGAVGALSAPSYPLKQSAFPFRGPGDSFIAQELAEWVGMGSEWLKELCGLGDGVVLFFGTGLDLFGYLGTRSNCVVHEMGRGVECLISYFCFGVVEVCVEVDGAR